MWLSPDWPAPSNVLALSTGRFGGQSDGIYRGLNLGDHVGDNLANVAANRQRLLQRLPAGAQMQWLEQVHGTQVVTLPCQSLRPQADASITAQANQFCTVMTADCLPLLICDAAGSQVAAVHAGWRGLLDGVIEQTLQQFSATAESLLVWLGPAIGPSCFEVGSEVQQAFVSRDPNAAHAFTPHRDRYFADLYQLARLRLRHQGVTAIYGGQHCTYSDPSRFYSYRRDGQTGRQASVIGLLPPERSHA
ncbi:peptidoglycan editing factor PgeF [uncultured Ferrimonas sp.]|uniref:peptidoglycan editing factor PgeF n=1 Tax=uncultured Ferrimonas sp. TaxID=432640 RepID=UPI00262050B7|nr:peptidoglycan editing factor PgeF [uncultured Ferrimonas sp.]